MRYVLIESLTPLPQPQVPHHLLRIRHVRHGQSTPPSSTNGRIRQGRRGGYEAKKNIDKSTLQRYI